ncbi:4-phosphoerythronate dehydrogenase [Psychromonas sp. B3M02]|uniref:4-phosphoerythronate dehydrogenase n=1 Tax=Psychromonas sp. B3M02 TaxID=2267226 RepID=UPI000DEACE8E|nr:4-phosphoerythronate dehydrogenase [Psychromonas sp. B3M02]RBW47173.1 4-phosphoerythronate dehydrogenase [Psychromonas sp. B3M02]
MKIYIDENMPHGRSFFESFGEVITFSGRDVTAQQIQDADILLVRSITKVNESLLALNKQIQFVGTATIGTDHIDIEYLQSRNIAFSSAPGCNKISVADYVLSALLVMIEQGQLSLLTQNVAIVGAGNTGTAVYDCLTAIGINCLLYDPPLQLAGDPREFCTFEQVLTADVISLHVPKTLIGEHKTFHLFNQSVLEKLNSQQILINACRGEVIDNKALLALAIKGNIPRLVLDVWENEPNIDKALLPYVALATPHIAGYSLDGRARGTEMLYIALCQKLQVPVTLKSTDFTEKAAISDISIDAELSPELLKSLVHLIYDVRRDDALFRKKVNEVNGFDNMRKNYPERRELSTLTVTMSDKWQISPQIIDLKKIGFTVKNK